MQIFATHAGSRRATLKACNSTHFRRAIPSRFGHNRAMTINRNIGMLLLAIYLILVGIIALTAVAIPPVLTGILALLAGIFILIGR